MANVAQNRMAYGQVSLSGTAAQLTAGIAGKIELKSFVIKSPATNVNPLFVGDSNVTSATGFVLAPGETFAIDGNNESGTPQFDLRPDEFYVVGTSPDVATWFAAGRGG